MVGAPRSAAFVTLPMVADIANRHRRPRNGNFKLNRMQRKAAMEQLERLEGMGNIGYV